MKVAKGHRKIYYYRMNNNNSCLSNYNPQTAINALWNAKNLLKVLPYRTRQVNMAIKERIWINYGFLIKHIIGSNSRRKYIKKYLFSHIGCIWLCIQLITKKEKSSKERWSLIKHSFFPDHYANVQIQKEKRDFELDSY